MPATRKHKKQGRQSKAGANAKTGDGAQGRRHLRSRHGKDGGGGTIHLYGIHAVAAALANRQRVITRLRLTVNAEKRLAEPLRKRGAVFELVKPKDLEHMLGPGSVHQGALLETEPLGDADLEDLANAASQGGPLIVLDQVTDPHNVGAVIRSAAAFGGAGLIMTRRGSPPLAGSLAKAASGGLEHVPVALVPNLARAMAALKDLGIFCIGLAGDGAAALEDQPLDGPLALIFGAEGGGLRRLTHERCDAICRIAAPGPITSLNVSNAVAISMHLAARHKKAPLFSGNTRVSSE